MLNLFLRVVLALAALVAVVLVIGMLLPRSFETETSIVIAAPVDSVFPQVNRLENWENWSPLSESRIRGLSVEYSGSPAGEGAIQTWSEVRGGGKMWITESQPDTRVEYIWRFDSFPELRGSFSFSKAETEGKTACRVVWTSRGSLPAGPFYGYTSLFFEGQLENEYRQCLERLKELVERAAAASDPAGKTEGMPQSKEQQATPSPAG